MHPGAVEPENLGFVVGSSQMRETMVLRFDRHWGRYEDNLEGEITYCSSKL